MVQIPVRRRVVLGAGVAALGATVLPANAFAAPQAVAHDPGGPMPSTRAALAQLLSGNRRFVAGRAQHPNQTPERVRATAEGQHPFAIILGCSDSRVAPELLFDTGIGDLFDNRVAGNIVDDVLLGSIEYAVEELAPPLLVVLGHERCGAIKATLGALASGTRPHGHIADVVAALTPVLTGLPNTPDGVERGVRANVRAQAAALCAHSEVIARAVKSGTLAVVGARYDLDTGLVSVLR